MDFVRAIEIRIIETTTASWEFWFGLLEKYIVWESHASPLTLHKDEDGYKLGTWVAVQRSAYKAGKLSQERIARLESLIPEGWVWGAMA